MATLTKFTLGPSGELVYKSTGKLAPSNYVFRKNTVYKVGADGVKRRIGSLSRKLTKTQATKIAKAERSRIQRNARNLNKLLGIKGKVKLKKTPFGLLPDDGQPTKPRSPSKTSRSMTYGEDWDEITDTEFPEVSEATKEEFAARVRAAAISVAPESLKAKIQALSTEAIYQAYTEDAFIFELYFRYHSSGEAPHTSDVSVWLYQFVNRVEQYMGVTV